MTRQESIDVTRHPGKFEGSALYAAYFYDLLMDGGGDETVGDCSTIGRIDTMFTVSADDIALFPELDGAECVVLTETDTGFVDAYTCTLAEWEYFVSEQEEVEDNEND